MSKKIGKILVVDDNAGIRKTLEFLLPMYFEIVKTISSPTGMISEIRDFKPDVVLLDMNFKAVVNTGNEGLFWIKEIKKSFPDIEVVLFTAYADIQLAVEGMKRGAFDFIVKPWDNDSLISVLNNAVANTKGKGKSGIKDSEMYWGDSREMLNIKETIGKIAPTDLNILITGENGVGKDLMAYEIHKLSNRNDKDIIPVDMGAITETLFESELFGHVKGAFSGAVAEHKGKFEQAEKGTIFLDEIGNLPLNLQAKLLRVIQNKKIVRVGGSKEIPIDVRIISATNKNLAKEVAEGRFREDLYYRLNGFEIKIPSLRERKGDILPLTNHFLDMFNEKYERAVSDISSEAKIYLTSNTWKGNIRELRSVIERATILADGPMINMDHIMAGRMNKISEIESESDERAVISSALEKTGHNISSAAKLLGISRPTLYSKIQKYGL